MKLGISHCTFAQLITFETFDHKTAGSNLVKINLLHNPKNKFLKNLRFNISRALQFHTPLGDLVVRTAGSHPASLGSILVKGNLFIIMV